jgi:segregation and condensation protein B
MDANPDEGGTAEDLARSYRRAAGRGADEPADAAPDEHVARAEAGAPPPLTRLVEAMLFLGGAPLTAARAAEAARGLTDEQFAEAVAALNRDYRRQGRPYRAVRREHGYELALLPRFRGVVERLYGAAREARLSPAALDVLALVAYRQPVTRAEAEALRGADCGPQLRQLVRLGLAAVQRGGAGGREVCYGTTPRFLALFRLRSLDDLPRTHDLERL